MFEMCSRFPGCIMVWITYPFDQVFLMVVFLVVVEDAFDFEFIMILEGYWVWWW